MLHKLMTLFRSETALLQKKGYVLGSDLGQGSYATVKSAIWQRPGAPKGIKVALKIINDPDMPQDFKEKFLPREIKIVQILNHPNVIKTMEIFNGCKKTYLALEFAGHGDMLSYIQLRGALKEQESACFFKQIAQGLSYLHERNIVHRDLKCENILLNSKNRIKLADFGFARQMSKQDLSKTYCGSAAYAAPEILQGIPYHGAKADIWSTGVILFVMNCALMPFRDGNMRSLIMDQRMPLRLTPNLEQRLSLPAKSLMQGILTYDLKKRLNMRQILAHEWIHINRPAANRAGSDSAIVKSGNSSGLETTQRTVSESVAT
ncbi:testis-specific serine/threonine-protein kinase 1-like [Clavelina lepadiformis]|uniref:testis-specific serine/threonine-protein kinase 1-like n=1 Tax=Clavelina lepadiformis TaxID=159417 RepID=UPI00404312FA